MLNSLEIYYSASVHCTEGTESWSPNVTAWLASNPLSFVTQCSLSDDRVSFICHVYYLYCILSTTALDITAKCKTTVMSPMSLWTTILKPRVWNNVRWIFFGAYLEEGALRVGLHLVSTQFQAGDSLCCTGQTHWERLVNHSCCCTVVETTQKETKSWRRPECIENWVKTKTPYSLLR